MKLVKLAVEEAQTGGHLATPSRAAPARLVDLGCGNARFTSAGAHLSAERGAARELEEATPFHMEVVGVDIKRQSRETNTPADSLDLGRRVGVFEGTIADARQARRRCATARDERGAIRGGRRAGAARVRHRDGRGAGARRALARAALLVAP